MMKFIILVFLLSTTALCSAAEEDLRSALAEDLTEFGKVAFAQGKVLVEKAIKEISKRSLEIESQARQLATRLLSDPSVLTEKNLGDIPEQLMKLAQPVESGLRNIAAEGQRSLQDSTVAITRQLDVMKEKYLNEPQTQPLTAT